RRHPQRRGFCGHNGWRTGRRHLCGEQSRRRLGGDCRERLRAAGRWSVMGTADFNNDGTLDVVLSNGTADEFQLLTSSGAVVSTVPALSRDGWQLQGTIDFDYDGNPDLLFQRIGSSQQEVDYLNGTRWTGRYSGVSGVTPDALHPLPGGDQDTDTVLSSVSYALPSGVENLTLIGTGNLNGTGNGLDNIITANSGNNVLTGGGGNDTFVFGPNFGKDSI